MPNPSNARYQANYRARQATLRKNWCKNIELKLLKLQYEIAFLRKILRKVLSSPTRARGLDTSSFLETLNPSSSFITEDARESRDSSNSTFDRWWEGYPEKVGKGAARKAFVKALTRTSLDQLEEGLAYYKAHKPKDRPWCNPATWLNQERWSDRFENGHASNEHKPRYGRLRDPTEIAKELGLKP